MFQGIHQRLKGWRTVIAARLLTLAGMLVGAHDYLLPYITGTDWSPITGRLPFYVLPICICLTGIVFDLLRHITDTPVGKPTHDQQDPQ